MLDILKIMLSLQNHISIYGSQFQNFQVFNSHTWLVVILLGSTV